MNPSFCSVVNSLCSSKSLQRYQLRKLPGSALLVLHSGPHLTNESKASSK